MVAVPVLALLLIDAGLLAFSLWKSEKSSSRSDMFLLSALFLCSGMPALIYQIVWQRTLFLIYGVNSQSVAVVVGIFMGIGMIMLQVKSPMLVAVGMYLPFETTFAIFLGGLFRSFGDWLAKRRGYNEAQMARVENAGVLTASGLIAGEAILGLLWAGLQFAPAWARPQIFDHPSYLAGVGVMVALAALMIRLPLSSAGDPKEPAPPTAIM